MIGFTSDIYDIDEPKEEIIEVIKKIILLFLNII